MSKITNIEIISLECTQINFNWTGDNLFTFMEWKNRGYAIKKGEHAIISTSLWKKVSYKDKETGEPIEHFILHKACLFSNVQVEKIEDKKVA